MPRGVRIVPQGEYVAESLQDYFRRHPDMDARCTKNATVKYYTTENPEKFKETARIFLHEQVNDGACRLGISLKRTIKQPVESLDKNKRVKDEKVIYIVFPVSFMIMAACSDDDTFTTSRSNLLSFSTDTLRT